MKLTSKEARNILEEERSKISNDGWIVHSICVGDCAGKIAQALNEKGYELDVDKAITLGYIHDIGRKLKEVSGHVIDGYEYMKKEGYDEEYCNVCLTHSYLNHDVNCTAGKSPKEVPFRTEFIRNHTYTIYEKIINLCDLMCAQKIYTVDKRLIDLIIRKGVYDHTQYHMKETYRLKEYFDDLLGYNLYDLFPEIKENL